MTSSVRMVDIAKRFGSVSALEGFELEVEQAQTVCLLGPSGCGKTTALRLIAGFERPDRGFVEINARRVASPEAAVPPERRRVGMVFQDYALFPHLSVRQNVAYGVRRDPDRNVRVSELLELVGLAGDAERMPHQLSGGMQQRVALARALAPRPDVILLDEPFSNLDQALRTQLRGELRQILRRAEQTAILVTHDQDEALTIADRVCVMSRGRIEQCASPEIVYAEPANAFVAGFVGTTNLVHAECRAGVAHTRFGPVRLIGSREARPEGRALAVLRPEHFDVWEAPDGPARSGPGQRWRVINRRFSGSELLYELEAPDGQRLWCEAGRQVRRLTVGDTVEVGLREIETVAFAVPGAKRAGVSEVPSEPVSSEGDRQREGRPDSAAEPEQEVVPSDSVAGPPP